jgi:UDP-N-acetylmuramoyl-tripeptide--D-alanyl-D-alanine ligase
VAAAKAELVAALSPGGIAIVPEGFPVTRRDIEVVRRGQPDTEPENGATRVRFDGRDVVFSFRGRHHAENALNALHAARAVGIDVSGTVDVTFSRWRGEEIALPGGGMLVNDSWNANPVSMRAALEDLADRTGTRRTVAVLGEMAELGAESDAYHQEIGALVADLGIDVLIAVGDRARRYVDAAHGVETITVAADAEEAAHLARDLVEPGDCVLVKGSRVAGLEVVADALAGVPN